MTHRTYIKCEVCGSTILVRTQIGHLPEHPIRIHCAKCGILISGAFKQDSDVPRFSIVFKNAIEIEMQDPDYYIEVSGELLTSKIRPFDKDGDEYPLPPFFNSLQAMEPKNDVDEREDPFLKFKSNYLDFLHFSEDGWPFIRRLHELWLTSKHDYLAEQMRDKLPADKFPLNNDLEYLRGIHQLFLFGFRSVIPVSFYDHTTKEIWSNIIDVAHNNPTGFLSITEFFNDSGMLRDFEGLVLKILNGFISRYPFLITAIGLESYNVVPDLSKNGTTTVSFDDVNHYYTDCYEAIGAIIPLVIAYNNLKYRNDPFVMPDSSFKTIKTLHDFIDMTNKGNKFTFCSSSEAFNNILCIEADNGLRNAISHGSYTYDGVTQIINYYSSGKSGKGEQNSIYLMEFIQKVLRQFYTMITLIELVYQTRKFYYVLHGLVPISSSVFQDKNIINAGRNKLCPCGSGKKFKKCCGSK